MVTFGGVELPLVLEVEERNRKVFVEQAIPGASLAKRLVRGGFGREFMVRGLIRDDTQTKLLMHCNGANGSQAFVDSSLYGRAITAHGHAQHDTSTYKLGTASAKFDNDGDDYLEITNSVGFTDFGYDDFTIDMWLRFSALNTGVIISQYQGDQHNWALSLNQSDGTYKISWTVRYGDWWSPVDFERSLPSLQTNTWYHFAFVRSGADWYMFWNGSLLGSKHTYLKYMNYYNAPVTVASLGPYIVLRNVWFDEVRISRGVARWTSDFTPPDREYDVRVNDYKATVRSLADGTPRALDFQDGSSTVTCLMLDPVFRESGKPNQALYEVFFVQSA